VYGEDTTTTAEQSPWFARLAHRHRPTTGWAVFLLTLGGVMLLPAALVNSEMFPGLDPVVTLSLAAFVFAWWLAHRRITGPAAAAVIVGTGILADLLWGVFVFRPLPLIGQLGAWWSWALGKQGMQASPVPEPAVTYFREQGAELGGYLQRVGWWIKGLLVGPGAPDNLAVLGLIILLCWCIAAWAAWWVARRGQPIVALLPTGVFLAQQAFWAPKTISYVLVFLGITAFLLVLARLVFNMLAWDAEGIDYAEDIRLDVLLTGLALTVLITTVSPALPFFASGEFSQRFWGLFGTPWRRVEQQVGASFQVPAPVRSLVPPSGAAEGGLPRAHLLGSAPQLSREVALRVRVRGDPTNLQLYWRGQTYAVYTGRGWENDPVQQVRSLQAGQPWAAELPSTEGRRPIVASFDVVNASRQVIYATGEPIGIDRPYRALLRGPGDLVALTSDVGVNSYTALSHVPEQNVTTLRATGTVYPTDVISRYLQLPANLDPRLMETAKSWTAGAQTPYDKAAAIEKELRKIPYSLDVPMPPAGRELVSWFLYDLKRGYCDYYASAMVVLARLSGIPARLAIGYGTGDLDRATGQYVVTEAQAHSWPELYFPGIGWVPFEPTAYMPQPARRASAEPALPPPGYERGPEDLATGMAEIQQSAAVNVAEARRQATNRGFLAAGMGLVLLWAVWLMRTTTRPVPYEAGESVEAFERLAAWGSRLGEPLSPGDTAREYAGELSSAADAVAGRARWRKARAAEAAGVVRNEARMLSDEVERSLFAPEGEARPQAKGWARLWSALREVWIAKVIGRSG
jgi:transglutaminase-like putative cysteine protease